MPHTEFDALFRHTREAVCLLDAEGRVLRMNPAAAARFGEGDAGRARFADVADWRAVREALQAEPHGAATTRVLSGAGDTVECEVTCVLLADDRGVQVIIHIPTVAEEAANTLQERHDADTGLPNRGAFLERLQAAIPAAQQAGVGCGVLHLDLNRFQIINETFGHAVGDDLLSLVAHRLDACVRPGDLVARGDGDDFLILLAGLRDPAEAVRVAERMHTALGGAYQLAGQEVYLGADVGAVVVGPHHDDAHEVLRDAEVAMSRARQTGRVQVFDPGMHEQSVAVLRMHSDLQRALEREELRVYYQPVVALSDGTVAGFEALVRWEHPERGLVPPVEFIPVAEESGLIVPIGDWVLDQAAGQLRDWSQRYPGRELAMGINLSVRQFARPGLVGTVQAVLARSGVDAAGLKLEVTESVIMGDAAGAIAVLHELKSLGVKLQVDDFGTGYSSLSYLHQFPLDILKIDRSFIVAMSEGSKHRAIVQAIVALSATLGLETTAEGVDGQGQVEQLRAMGCTYGQGYFWSKPVPADQAEALLAGR